MKSKPYKIMIYMCYILNIMIYDIYKYMIYMCYILNIIYIINYTIICIYTRGHM